MVPISSGQKGSEFDRMQVSGEADVLVIGAGGAGLVAAAAAADAGARVIQFEKTDRIGGCWLPGIGNAGSVSGAQTTIQFESGIFDDSPYRFYADCMRDPRAMEVCSPDVLAYYCSRAGQAVDWLDRLGAFGQRERRARPGLFGEAWAVQRSYYMAPDFLTVVASYHHRRVERGDITLMTNTRVVSLVVKDGLVKGVIVVRSGMEHIYCGKAVIVCTGGFGGDIGMIRRHNFPGARIVTSVAVPFATGDGLAMCTDAGARLVNMGGTMVMGPFLSGIPDPVRPGRELATVNFASSGLILVDKNGQRFINEDCGRLSPKLREALLKCLENYVVAVFDSSVVRDEETLISGQSRDWFLRQAEEGAVVKSAENIHELGVKVGVDAAGLVANVERWNAQVEAGHDSDFNRGGVLRKISHPPYYAIPLGVRVVASSGGPETTLRQEVVGVDGKIIPGLFAAGEVAGYQGYGTGMLNTGCVVFGFQAGRMAAYYARNVWPCWC